jgi:formylglycine-generating enzyme required for sulfatase activity
MKCALRCLLPPSLLSVLCLALALRPQPGQSAPAPLTKKHFTNSIGMKLVRIPPGKFMMGEPGASRSHPAHEVEISRAFFMSVHHVTQGQYQKVVGTNPSYFSPTGAGKAQVGGVDTTDFPVETVSWDDAIAFCKKLSALRGEKAARRVYRLPTEAEWEYACRAGTTTAYNCGKTLSKDQANFSPSRRVTKVGSYKANAWGLYDMHGNVWHMCADWYDQDYYRVSPKKDPQGPAKGTYWVARGGSWCNPANACSSAYRAWVSSGQRNYLVGFRVACDVGRRR